MRIESPGQSRAEVTQTQHGLEIVIPAQRNWFVMLFLATWLVFWAMGELSMLAAFIGNLFLADETIPSVMVAAFMGVWLAGWTYGGYMAGRTLLWQLMGKEQISLARGILRITRNYRLFRRSKHYEVAHIDNLRHETRLRQRGSVQQVYPYHDVNALHFDYGATEVTFGQDLEKLEGQQLVAQLQQAGLPTKGPSQPSGPTNTVNW